MAKSTKARRPAVVEPSGITEIKVAGFKSIADEQSIDIRPLTILAGANSSGKSSIMQPLLLLKQTLEETYDAGPIQLNGPNVKFTSADQLLSRIGKGQSLAGFHVGLQLNTGDGFVTYFEKEHRTSFRIERTEITWAGRKEDFWPEMTHAQIAKTGISKGMDLSQMVPEGYSEGQLKIVRDRCFIGPVWEAKGSNGTNFSHGLRPGPMWEEMIPRVIHLPGWRGNSERAWPVAAVGPTFRGTFEKYTASVILKWIDEDDDKLDDVNANVQLLKLTSGVSAKRLSGVQIELYVGRLPDSPPKRPEDQVNIADVGLGVSQTLPVLVALHAAKPGTVVYVEQPETHLHPQAQFVLAQILANAAKRGVRVVAETHSTMLLLGVQALVAEGKLDPDLVKLHWFRREKDGRTIVHPGDLDEAGAFGEWPQDFDDVELGAQKRYLDAADKRMFAR